MASMFQFYVENFVVELLMIFPNSCFVTFSLIVIKTHFRQRKTRNFFAQLNLQVHEMLLNFFTSTSPKKLFYYLQRHAEVIEQKVFQFTHFRETSSLHFTRKVVTFYGSTRNVFIVRGYFRLRICFEDKV